MSNQPTKLYYEFGSFRLDPERKRLLNDSEVVAITPKAVDTLRVLIERRGQLVEREDLMNSVWQELAVEDGNLTVTISMLRKILGDDTHGRSFIETVPRRGYKFVADVREVYESVPTLIVETQIVGRVEIAEEFSLLKPDFKRLSAGFLSSFRRRLATATVAVVALLAVGAFIYSSRSEPLRVTPHKVRSIAVLPFKVIRAPNENEHQGLELADVLITRLSNIREINVRPTSAVLSLENTQENSATIGQRLLVDAILEGSILQINDKIRITARLVRVEDQSPIWAAQFEKPVTDQFQLQNEIAVQVVDALALNLTGSEETALTKRFTRNQDAFELYLKGRYQWNKRNYGGLSEAQHLFRGAIDKDPEFALAYVGLADSLIFSQDSIQSNAALAKALELDPNLSEAWASKGFILTMHEWRWKDAEESFKKAIQINPGYATAHHWYAILLEIQGRNEEAKAELRRALEIDPTSYNFLADLGQVYYLNREYDTAKEYCNKALRIYPSFAFAHQYLYAISLKTGEYETALEELVEAQLSEFSNSDNTATLEANRQQYLDQYRELYHQGGVRKFFEFQLALTTKTNARMSNPNRWYEDAYFHTLLDDKEKALDCLERAFESRAFLMAWVKAEPVFDPLRSQRRFKAILQKMNLPSDG